VEERQTIGEQPILEKTNYEIKKEYCVTAIHQRMPTFALK